MPTTSETFLTALSRKVGADRQGLDPSLFVAPAVRLYERFRPREVVTAVTGDGTSEYALASVLPLWLVGFSRVLWVEYEVDQTPPSYLDPNDYAVRRVANTGSNSETRVEKLYLSTISPSASETFRVAYTARHVVDGTYSTIPAEDEEAVADFAAALFLEELAVRYSGLVSQSGLMAEQVIAYTEKAQDARANAKMARKRAREAMGLSADGDDGPTTVPSLSVVDADLSMHEGRGALTHHRWFR